MLPSLIIIGLKQLKHAQENFTMLEGPDASCSAKFMHQAPGSQAAKAAQETPSGSQTQPGHTNTSH